MICSGGILNKTIPGKKSNMQDIRLRVEPPPHHMAHHHHHNHHQNQQHHHAATATMPTTNMGRRPIHALPQISIG